MGRWSKLERDWVGLIKKMKAKMRQTDNWPKRYRSQACDAMDRYVAKKLKDPELMQ